MVESYRIFAALAGLLVVLSACERAGYVKDCLVDADCDDGNACTSDLCTVGECHYLPFPDGQNCNDGDPCTTKDVCVSAQCQGQPKDCSGYGGICTQGACDPQSGECRSEPKPDGTGCDDGLYCTVDDSCLGGACTGNQRLCDDGDGCTRDECNEGDDLCDYVLEPRPGAEGPPGDPTCGNSTDDDCDRLVDDQDPNCIACTGDPQCEDDNECTEDACLDNICHNDPVSNGTECNDGRYCTEPDTCTGGVCGGAPRDCSTFADACNNGVCVESNSACEAQPKVDNTPCEDGLYCNVGETCQSGDCTGGEPRDCDDSDFCTADACNEDTNACDHTVQQIPEAEGPPGDPTCSNGLDDDCDGFTDLDDGNCCECFSDADCNDDNPCTADDCAAGDCTNLPEEDGTGCDDGDPCSTLDACSGGFCIAGETNKDTDGDSCYDGLCPGGDDCDDGDYDVNPGVLEGPEGDPKCSDGKDNDCDGLTDLDDLGCRDLCAIVLTTVEMNPDGTPVEGSHNHRMFSPQAAGAGEVMIPNISGLQQKFLVYGQYGSWDTVSCNNSSWLAVDYGDVTFEVIPQYAGDPVFFVSGATGVGASVSSVTNQDRVDVIRATVDAIPNVCTGGVCQSEISINACGVTTVMDRVIADTFTPAGFTEEARTTFPGDDSIRYYAVEGFKPSAGTTCTFTETGDSQPWYLDTSEDVVWVSQSSAIATVSNTSGSRGNIHAVATGCTLIQANWNGGAPEDTLGICVAE